MKLLSLLFSFVFTTSLLFAQPGSVQLRQANGTLISSHASITEAYAAILPPVTQAYLIELQSSYVGSSESVPLVLGAKSGTSASNTITIRPAANFGSITLSAPANLGNLVELNNADYLILDGRPGGVGTTRAITLHNTATNGNTIGLINGSSHNIIRYLQLTNSGSVSGSSNIALLSSTAQPEGNSNNRFEFILSSGSISGFRSFGTVANPNHKNIFYGNEIQSAFSSGIHMQLGTAGVIIDSNLIYSTNVPSTVMNYGILFDTQTDTAIIRNNLIYDVYTSNEAASVGISIRSTSNLGNVNYSEIYNNFVSMNQIASNSTKVVGIEYGGVYPTDAKIMFNTVSIGGTLSSGGLSEQVLSAAFLKTGTNVNSSFYLRNNIFINNRSGGVSGGQHVVVAFTNTMGIVNSDFNTYNTPGTLARFGTATYSSLSAYAFALGGANEANSNLTPVQLTSANDLRLTGTSLGNPNLGGTALADIVRDRFNTTRSNVPYRGAHEASPSLAGTQCQGAPFAGDLTQSDTTICPGSAPVLLRLTQAATGGGIVYEWQESTNNNTFSAITGVNTDSLLVNPATTRWYRVLTRCVPSGLQVFSDTVRVVKKSLPVVGALSFSRVGASYNFDLNNSAQVDSFIWNFGDGSGEVVTLVPLAQHTFTVNGAYPVRVKAVNACGIDSIQLNLNVTTVSVEKVVFPTLRLFPNPVADVIYIQGMTGAYSIQLRDLQGRLLQSIDTDSDYDLKMTTLKPAIYLLEIADNTGKRSIHRLIKN